MHAGADRLEICSALELGGLTPGFGLTRRILQETAAPCMVMIRPRAGDFVYQPAEIRVMLEEIRQFRSLGVEGVVFGALDRAGGLCQPTMEALLTESAGMQVTFHRALDATTAPLAALAWLAAQGVQRVLSSGQAASAERGAATLAAWNRQWGRSLTIMPGGGVTPENAERIVREVGAAELHFSGSVVSAAESGGLRRGRTDADRVRAIRQAACRAWQRRRQLSVAEV